MIELPTPETDAFSGNMGDCIKFAEKLERERDEAREEWGKASMDAAQLLSEKTKVIAERDEEREQNAYLRCIAERAIDYLDQSYRDGFSDEASELRYELKQLKEGGK